MSVEYQKEIQLKVSCSSRKTHHPEKESDWLILHCKIEQTIIKKAATKWLLELI